MRQKCWNSRRVEYEQKMLAFPSMLKAAPLGWAPTEKLYASIFSFMKCMGVTLALTDIRSTHLNPPRPSINAKMLHSAGGVCSPGICL